MTTDAAIVTAVYEHLTPIVGSILHMPDVAAALKAMSHTRFDAILLDSSSGAATATAITVLDQNAPDDVIVVICEHEPEAGTRTPLDDGADDYIARGELHDLLSRTVVRAIERQACRNAVRERENRYQTIIDGSVQGILIHTEGVARLVNPALATLLGVDSAYDLVGNAIWPFIHRDDRLRVRRYLQARADGMPSPDRYELRLVTASGAEVWVECFSVSIQWDGKPATLVTLIDISERKRAEQSLQAAQDQLVQAQKLDVIGRLASGVAHDFNNLLTAILGFSSLVIDDLGPDHPSTPDVEQILNSAEIGQSLTSQLLGLSRRQIVETETLDLNNKLERLGPLLRRLVGAGIQLEVQAESDPCCVSIDPGQMDQVILNLVLNARDAMPTGGAVVLRTGRLVAGDEEYIALSVADSGTGMDDALKRRILEPFFTTKEFGKGTGLGLSTVNTIVQQARGWLSVQSVPGHGSTFTVYLPLAEQPATDETAPTTADDGTVLLVEPQPQVRTVACEILRRHGYRVIEAGRGTEALNVVRNHTGQIDAAIIDMALPDLHGTTLAELLTAINPRTRILMTTSATFDHGPSDAPLHQGWTHVTKPFTAETLVSKLRRALH